MQKKAPKKASLPKATKAKKNNLNSTKNTKDKKDTKDKLSSTKAVKAVPAKKQAGKTASGKAAPAATIKDGNKPGLRSVYSNSRHTLLPLGFATDFKTKKPVVIFSDLATGQVHTVALSVWNRWKLKEVKKINTET